MVGADAALIWFGVMLCVNVQTSFMHPPFGFALFYLRSVAPKEVKSSDIYWGSVPWVLLQLIMVAIVIAFPQSVTYFLDTPSNVDPTQGQDRDPGPAQRGLRARRSSSRRGDRPTEKAPPVYRRGFSVEVASRLQRPWADIEKLKLSKVFSATRNHRFWSARKAFRLS